MRAAVALVFVTASACNVGGASARPPRSEAPRTTQSAVLVGAGDIARCGEPGAEATAKLLDRIDGTVFALGDNAYDTGSAAEFARCYAPSWGRHRHRTRPEVGNHEYGTERAAGHFAYFGPSAGERGRGYYSYDLGAWHVVVLNSSCDDVGGCDRGSAQLRWLREDLEAHATGCALAYWHHPRFSSGSHGDDREFEPFWDALYDVGAELVLVGHDHLYERFAPQNPEGGLDLRRGIRQFTVGTGGADLTRAKRRADNSEVRQAESFGVLKLTLHEASYGWEFIPVAGATFSDTGSGACH